jgi:hypothetical protein
VHQVPVAVDDVAFLDVDRELARGAATGGEGAVGESDADGLEGDGVNRWAGGREGGVVLAGWEQEGCVVFI